MYNDVIVVVVVVVVGVVRLVERLWRSGDGGGDKDAGGESSGGCGGVI